MEGKPEYKTEHDLLFKHCTYRQGLNVTVRSGNSWQEAKPGDTLNLYEAGDPSVLLGTALCLGIRSLDYKNIPQALLDFECDPGCRTIVELEESMNRTYGPDVWGDYVTVVVFWVTKLGAVAICDQILQDRSQRAAAAIEDKNTVNDWVAHTVGALSLASSYASAPSTQRMLMLSAASICVAACEAFDRNEGFAPRHYEDRVPRGKRPVDD